MEQAKNGAGKGGRKALWTAVAVIAIAAAGLTGYKFTLEKTIAAQLEKRGGKAASVEADFLGRIHLRDVVLPLKEGSDVRIASVDGRPKFLFLTGMLDASGIDTQIGSYKISIPHVSIDDANFDQAMLKDTFGNSGLTLPERIGRFSAKRVAASEVNVTQTIAGNEQKIVYKDVALEDVDQGRVARYSADSSVFDVTLDVPGDDGQMVTEQMTGSIGATEGKDIDGVFLARLYTDKAGPDDSEAKPVYGPFSAKKIVVKTKDADFSYDEIRSAGFTMRLPAEPLTELLEKIQTVGNPEELSPAERRDFILRALSLADTIGKGDVELLGLKIQPKKGPDGESHVDRVAVTFDKQTMDVAVKGISLGNDKDYIKMDEASVTGFSWAPSVEGLKKLAVLSDEEVEAFPFTTLLPQFGTWRVTGIEADLPHDQEEAGGEEGEEPAEESTVPVLPERLKFAIKSYEIALNKPYNGIPTDIRVAYDGMSLPVPAEGKEEVYSQLRKLGYDNVIVSSNVEAHWDEPNQTLVIKDISVSGEGMGSIALSGLMGGFTKEFFSGDKVMMQVAALGLKAHEAKLKIEEKGLITRGLKLYAEENNVTEEEVRSSVALIAAASLQEIAADQPHLQDVITAFSAFLAKPNIFEVMVKAKAEKGLGALDMLTASQNPLSLLEKVNIEAKAE